MFAQILYLAIDSCGICAGRAFALAAGIHVTVVLTLKLFHFAITLAHVSSAVLVRFRLTGCSQIDGFGPDTDGCSYDAHGRTGEAAR